MAVTSVGMSGVSPLSGSDYGIRWVGDRDALKRYLERIVNGIDTSLVKDVGEMVRKRIFDRTSAGIDVDGKAFAPYGEKYKKWKETIRPASPVNLQLFDEMLNAMRFKYIRSGSIIIITFYFEGNLQQVKAWVLDSGGLSGPRDGRFYQQKRHFFGVNTGDVRAVDMMIIDRIQDLILESAPGNRRLF